MELYKTVYAAPGDKIDVHLKVEKLGRFLIYFDEADSSELYKFESKAINK